MQISSKSVSAIRRLIGMTGWYRHFVPQYSTVIAPVTELLKKNRPFRWTQACDEAWSLLRERLTSSPIWTSPDFEHEFVIQTDASDYGLGAVLSQNVDGQERVELY